MPYFKGWLRRERRRLWDINPHCHYCGVTTVFPPSGKCWAANEPNNMATLDHLYSRWDIRRLFPASEKKVVLSCLKCNRDKNFREMRMNAEYSDFNRKVIDIDSFIQHQKLSNK